MTDFCYIDGEHIGMSRKQNTTTTLESLEAVIKMILADNEEDFINYYSIATHDNKSGATCWYYMNRGAYANNEDRQKYYKEYYKKNKAKYLERNKAKNKELKPIQEEFNFE